MSRSLVKGLDEYLFRVICTICPFSQNSQNVVASVAVEPQNNLRDGRLCLSALTRTSRVHRSVQLGALKQRHGVLCRLLIISDKCLSRRYVYNMIYRFSRLIRLFTDSITISSLPPQPIRAPQWPSVRTHTSISPVTKCNAKGR